jgi:short subunit dehydrogenase-like uncharacterized protein
MPSTLPIAVYGATGHTGRFVILDALQRGVTVVAVGRSADRLEAEVSPAVARRTAVIDDPMSLERAFAGCGVVINCAGPFMDTAGAVAQAALRAGCHYIDVSAEQPSTQATFARFDVPARAAGKVVIPAAGFYGGLADILAGALVAEGAIDDITIAVALDRWWPTAGTRRTGERNKAPRLVVSRGRLAPLVPTDRVPDWVFAPPLGQQAMVELPFSEIITLAHHLKAGEIRSLLNRTALHDVRDPRTPAPVAEDASGRSAQRFELAVRLVQNGLARTASVRGRDIYAVTAPIVMEAAQRLLQAGCERSGALALAEALDPSDLLRSLQGSVLELCGLPLLSRID